MRKPSIYAAHEARMWIVQVIVPVTIGIICVWKYTDIPERVGRKYHNIKQGFKKRFSKKEKKI